MRYTIGYKNEKKSNELTLEELQSLDGERWIDLQDHEGSYIYQTAYREWKKKMNKIESPNYLDLRLHQDEGRSYQIKVPTFWDPNAQTWGGALKLPISNKIIHTCGVNSQELQENFTNEFIKFFKDEKYKQDIKNLLEEM